MRVEAGVTEGWWEYRVYINGLLAVDVVWADTDERTWRQYEQPIRVCGDETVSKVRVAQSLTIDEEAKVVRIFTFDRSDPRSAPILELRRLTSVV